MQEAGAGIVSLGGLYADPVAGMRRARARRPGVVSEVPEASA
ncbi:Transcriptional regulator [Mycobacterium talmoniae]|uniref:Transcriptional regulator n=1 Tax=Mycobacterium talmoniae TaxID=1858794 RepID=A0A2S8BBK4_9MYCO|nr:Transcriptional regulator [Mycobacterium talmoniae]